MSTASSSNRHQCAHCPRVFTKPAHLLRHTRSHVSDRPFTCSFCHKSFTRTDTLQRHERTVHSTKRPRAEQFSASEEEPEGWTEASIPDLDMANSGWYGEPSENPPAFDFGFSMPDPSYVPPELIPSSAAEVNDMIAGWLSQDGGLGLEGLFPSTLPNTDSSTVSAFAMPPDNATGRLFSPRPVRPSGRHRRRTVVAVDTWESGVTASAPDTVSRAQSPQLPFTSPEQVVGKLNINGPHVSMTVEDTSVIPSMKFLDACLHLYFRDFHPSFPVIHRPTFERDRASPLLLLSMCSIGCMFVGTQAATDSGLWIYHRLHLATLLQRDGNMANEKSRLDSTLSALIGQSFSFLHGRPREMLTADSFHETVCSMARRSGLFPKTNSNPVTFEMVRDLEGDELHRRWRQWGRQETLRRICLGLAVHGAELSVFSGFARLMPSLLTAKDAFHDALFEAEDAQTWRELLSAHDTISVPDESLSVVVLAQALVQVHQLREIGDTLLGEDVPLRTHGSFFRHMMSLAQEINITSLNTGLLSSLWHYVFVARLAPLTLIEEAAGRSGDPSPECLAELRAWIDSPAARLGTLHCGQVLLQAEDLRDKPFILPRAVFHAALVLMAYLSFIPDYSGGNVVTIGSITNWEHLALVYDSLTVGEIPATLSAAEDYVVRGQASLRVRGFLDGKERQMDMFSLRSAATRLLGRCTPWGIGATLGRILSDVSFSSHP